jgi:hypothetical protein
MQPSTLAERTNARCAECPLREIGAARRVDRGRAQALAKAQPEGCADAELGSTTGPTMRSARASRQDRERCAAPAAVTSWKRSGCRADACRAAWSAMDDQRQRTTVLRSMARITAAAQRTTRAASWPRCCGVALCVRRAWVSVVWTRGASFPADVRRGLLDGRRAERRDRQAGVRRVLSG